MTSGSPNTLVVHDDEHSATARASAMLHAIAPFDTIAARARQASAAGGGPLHRHQPKAAFQRSLIDSRPEVKEGARSATLRAIGGFAILLTGGEAAMAKKVPDLRGTWIPTEGCSYRGGTHQAPRERDRTYSG